ncbi:MAG: protein kinase [Vicinamibacterales bacterium]
MNPAPGVRIGAYEIVELLGEGGMGEVYKALDTRLDRSVAIKVLPEHLAADAELLQRFKREARALAALSHPHICQIYDVGSHNGVHYLVMEYVEGETLAQRLTQGALPLDRALPLAIQVADALDKAHRTGIVHRDLKPANVMLTKAGVKLLDFGLAKLAPQSESLGRGRLSEVSTGHAPLTGTGSILGTFHYMAPEQLDGGNVDARADIFSFGALVYEAITGRRAFEGASQASVIAAILERTPPPLSALMPVVPKALDRIITTCLAKDPDDRWQTARDVSRELRWLASGVTAPEAVPVAVRRAPPRRGVLIAGIGLLTAALVAALVPAIAHWREVKVPAQEVRFRVDVAPRFDDTVVISPDGRMLAFDGIVDGKWQLWVRPLDSLEARPLNGTDGAIYPFWSPDSRSLGFFADGKLKRISVDGGPPQTLAAAPEPRGGTWGRDGVIVFAPSLSGGLARVPAAGGEVAAATTLRSGEISHRFPAFLPDGRHVLFLTAMSNAPSALFVGAVGDELHKRLFTSESTAIYSSNGYVLFRREGALVAQRFSLASLDVEGDPLPVSDRVGSGPNIGSVAVSASDSGAIVFRDREGQGGPRRLVWFDRTGRELGELPGELVGPVNSPDLSPDGQQVAFHTTFTANIDVFIANLARGTRSRLTTGVSADQFPIWSPDGRSIVFNSQRRGSFDLYRLPPGGDVEPEVLLENPGTTMPSSWSPDGRLILYTQLHSDTGFDVYALPLDGDRTPAAVAKRPHDEANAQLSKDMRWVAYESNESGRFEIVVQPFGGAGPKWQVSTDGGQAPRWRADGRELFYVTPDGTLMGVPMEPSSDGTSMQSGTAVPLVKGQVWVRANTTAARGQYAVTPDGLRFLAVVSNDEMPPAITVVLNWQPRR